MESAGRLRSSMASAIASSSVCYRYSSLKSVRCMLRKGKGKGKGNADLNLLSHKAKVLQGTQIKS